MHSHAERGNENNLVCRTRSVRAGIPTRSVGTRKPVLVPTLRVGLQAWTLRVLPNSVLDGEVPYGIPVRNVLDLCWTGFATPSVTF
jgi:hypothetical protein